MSLHAHPVGAAGSADTISESQGSKEARKAVQALDTSNIKPLSECKRFAVMTAAVFAMICASTSYAFNLFSGSLQKTYNFDSRAMSSINTVGMVFAYFLVPYGFIYDYLGPLPIYIIACVYFSLGALLMGLTFQGVITGSVPKFCVYNALLSSGSQLFDLGTVVTLMSVFPTRRGWVVCILKTLMGLGTSIIGAIQVGFFSTSPASYFYFLIALVVVVGVAVMSIVKLPPYHLTQYEKRRLSVEEKAERATTEVAYLTQEPPMWRFYYGIGIICVLVVYLPLTSALVAFLKLNQTARMAIAIAAIIITLFMLLIMMPWGALDRMTTAKGTVSARPSAEDEEDEDLAATYDGEIEITKHAAGMEPTCESPREAQQQNDHLRDELAVNDEIYAYAPKDEKAAPVKTVVDYIAPQYQTTFLQSLCTFRLWAIFWTMFCGLGSEFVIIFNARFIYGALDGKMPDDTVAVLLSVLNGAGSAVGRMAMSVFEMKTQNRPPEKRIPITIAFFVPTGVIIVSIALFLVLPGKALLLAYAIAAIGNGFCASITILVLRTIYAKDPAKHYNFSINALVPASVLINRFLYGEWYAVQADKQDNKTATGAPSNLCFGKKCVLMPLLVMLGMNITAFASTIYVHFSYMNFCRKALEEHHRVQEKGNDGFGKEGNGEIDGEVVKPPVSTTAYAAGIYGDDLHGSSNDERNR